jgi:pimeloyl-ACP methyl ester carboxylesterase
VNDWREVHRPDLHWAPSGLPGWMRSLPGWAARGLSESRLPVEAATLLASDLLRDPDLPRGNGESVMLVPGFGFGDPTLLPMHAVLRRFGYSTVRSGIVSNIDCSDRTVDVLARIAAAEVDRSGERIQVVGQSRGGMLARGLGARRPDLVSRAINLGGPLNDEFAFYEIPSPLVSAVYASHRLRSPLPNSRCLRQDCPCPYMQAVHRPMPEQTELVSIYSASDGVIDWRSCVVPGARNLRVESSHLGMGVDPRVLRLVIEELARPSVGSTAPPE